jgi:4,4'-diaponeurosporenoate glycosyltransferase
MDFGWLGTPSSLSIAIYLVGWISGWLAFVRIRSLPSAGGTTRGAVTVIVPCRNEAENLTQLLPNLGAVLGNDDEVIVVDDQSNDATSLIARNAGVVVVQVDSIPDGWAGKPYACWLGAQRASHSTLVFLDADVRLGMSAIDDLMAVLDRSPNAVVSAMPWHRTGALVEQSSMLFNTVQMMVASVGASDTPRRVAYGPFLAVRRATYLEVGGHSHPTVRGAVVEDLALARIMPGAVATVARPDHVEYRMYPLGWRQLLEGWTKNLALGSVSVPRISAALLVVWIISLCGGPITSVWMYLASVLQVGWFARRAGNFGWFSALAYPLHAALFVAIAVRSGVRSVLFGRVVWRGRSIATRRSNED